MSAENNESFYSNIEKTLTISRKEFLDKRERIVKFLAQNILFSDNGNSYWKSMVQQTASNNKKSFVISEFKANQTFTFENETYSMAKFYHSLFTELQSQVHPFLLKKQYNEISYSIIMLLPFKKE